MSGYGCKRKSANRRVIRNGCIFLLVLVLGAPTQATDPTVSEPVLTASQAGELIVENLLSREHMFYGEEALHYAEAATAVGALRFASSTNNQAMLAQLVSRYTALLHDDSGLFWSVRWWGRRGG